VVQYKTDAGGKRGRARRWRRHVKERAAEIFYCNSTIQRMLFVPQSILLARKPVYSERWTLLQEQLRNRKNILLKFLETSKTLFNNQQLGLHIPKNFPIVEEIRTASIRG
jgi:hypothetical protein